MPPSEVSQRQIVKCAMRLDLMAAHTIVEDYKAEKDKVQNVEPHFKILWGLTVKVSSIMGWLRSDKLYQNPDLVRLPDFEEFVGALPLKELGDLLKKPEASLFYVRLVKGRIRKLEDQKTVVGLAVRDLRNAFEINLGLLVQEKAVNESVYLTILKEKQFDQEHRLSRVLIEAVRLRDLVTEAFRQGHLDEDLLPGLRMRIGALEEHYSKARELLGDHVNMNLVDHTIQDWL
jgi:hypothetical protein